MLQIIQIQILGVEGFILFSLPLSCSTTLFTFDSIDYLITYLQIYITIKFKTHNNLVTKIFFNVYGVSLAVIQSS